MSVDSGGYTMGQVAKIVGDVPEGLKDASLISPQLRDDTQAVDLDVQVLRGEVENLTVRLGALEAEYANLRRYYSDATEAVDAATVVNAHPEDQDEYGEAVPQFTVPERMDKVEGFLKRHFGGMFG